MYIYAIHSRNINNAVFGHSMEQGHLPSWDKVEVLEWEHDWSNIID